jgi:hypothetical protein
MSRYRHYVPLCFTLQHWTLFFLYLRDCVTRFFVSGFFRESSSPKPFNNSIGFFQIFSKIRGDICKSRCTTGINDNGGKFATNTASVVDTADTLKRTWRKIYLYVDSTTQGCEQIFLFIFWLKTFLICHPQRHWWCTLSCEYLRKFWKNLKRS